MKSHNAKAERGTKLYHRILPCECRHTRGLRRCEREGKTEGRGLTMLLSASLKCARASVQPNTVVITKGSGIPFWLILCHAQLYWTQQQMLSMLSTHPRTRGAPRSAQKSQSFVKAQSLQLRHHLLVGQAVSQCISGINRPRNFFHCDPITLDRALRPKSFGSRDVRFLPLPWRSNIHLQALASVSRRHTGSHPKNSSCYLDVFL